jgi:hypothetical protein
VFTLATDSAPGRPNEDFVIATADLAVVVDGAGIPFGGCHHGVAWYARQLGARTLAALVATPQMSLTDGLAEGISAVADLHSGTCDLTSAGTPCAAIGILRLGDVDVDVLSLSDVTVVVDVDGRPEVTCDLSIEEISGTEPAAVAGHRFGTPGHAHALVELVKRQTATRNRDGGWWVAAADPSAAQHAKVAHYPRSAVARAAVLSDGATRPVDQMGIYGWPEYVDLIEKLGPEGLISQVRLIEEQDADGERYPRTKRHDDASLTLWTRNVPRSG